MALPREPILPGFDWTFWFLPTWQSTLPCGQEYKRVHRLCPVRGSAWLCGWGLTFLMNNMKDVMVHDVLILTHKFEIHLYLLTQHYYHGHYLNSLCHWICMHLQFGLKIHSMQNDTYSSKAQSSISSAVFIMKTVSQLERAPQLLHDWLCGQKQRKF